MLELKLKPYKGYTGVLRSISVEDNMIAGRVAGMTQDMVTFYASSPGELQAAFETALDAYLESFDGSDESPEKPASGNFQVRVSSETHRALVVAADLAHKPLNQVVASVLDNFANKVRVALVGGTPPELDPEVQEAAKTVDPINRAYYQQALGMQPLAAESTAGAIAFHAPVQAQVRRTPS